MVSRSLEERIAELSRQSTEAWDKLLELIDQQKSAASDMVPPMLSPVPTPTYIGKHPSSGETRTSKTGFLFWRVFILLHQWLWSAVQSPSLDVLKERLDVVHSALVCLTRWCSKVGVDFRCVFFNLISSVIVSGGKHWAF